MAKCYSPSGETDEGVCREGGIEEEWGGSVDRSSV